MNLDKIVKHGKEVAIVTAGLVGAVLGSGCNIETIYGMGIAGNAYKTHDPYAANVMGNALMREGEAKEGRSETVVVVQQPREENSNNNNPQPQVQNQPQNREVSKPWPKTFACNYMKDINEDGVITYPDEVIGEKRKFTTKEKITIVRGPEGEGDFTFKVFDKEDNLFYKNLQNKKNGRCTVRICAPGTLKAGTYLVVWYNGEKVDSSLQIEVINE